MTVYAWYRKRELPGLPPSESRFFDVAPDTRVLGRCNWQPMRKTRPTVILLHGLEGSSEAHYMRGMAEKAFLRGLNVVRLNQRTCGGTEHLSNGLYHSGLTADPLAVIRELRDRDGLPSFGVGGYSLGGNITMRMAGELGERDMPEVKAFCAVSPVIELEACTQSIERLQNRIYEWNFCRNLRARMRRKAQTFPHAFNLDGLGKIWSIRRFDTRYTAPHHDFGTAENYYFLASAMRVIDQVRRPALILSAADDPFVPPGIFATPEVRNNKHIEVSIPPHGGHCGFVEVPQTDDGYYAERTLINFLSGHFNS